MATHSTAAFTADDVLDLPLPTGVSGYEFVDGQPVPVMPASLVHGRLIVEVARRLANHVIEKRLAGTVLSDAGFVLGLRHDPERMRGPDVVYVNREKVEAHADPEPLMRCAPDLVSRPGDSLAFERRCIPHRCAAPPRISAASPSSSRLALRAHRRSRCARNFRDGTLAIEIDLTSAKKPGGKRRIAEYLEAGARLVWAIDPRARGATVHWPDGSVRLVREDGILDGEDVVPGFCLRLRDLFDR